MASEISHASIYTDFQGLAKLRVQAQLDSKSAIRSTAKQFESLFIRIMLKEMRNTVEKSELFNQENTSFYEDMYDQQLSVHLAEGPGLGLTQIIQRQLSGVPFNGMHNRAIGDYQETPISIPDQSTELMHGPDLRSELQPGRMDSPEAFVEAIWSHAQRAGQQLGVDPKILVAQSALETGWGKHLIQGFDGASANNLFGIKADPSWNGRQASVSTLEYENGLAVRGKEAFRTYNSIAEGFDDYVHFIKNNPRYQEALSQAADPKAYVTQLQNAGYATDPQYAQKIYDIYDGDILRNATMALESNMVSLR